jgi:hypothetical protein
MDSFACRREKNCHNWGMAFAHHHGGASGEGAGQRVSLPELVDLYGTAGFDVLSATDHILREDDPWPVLHGRPCVNAENIDAYLAEIERERVRALSTFGLVLVPGLELTYNDPDPTGPVTQSQ